MSDWYRPWPLAHDIGATLQRREIHSDYNQLANIIVVSEVCFKSLCYVEKADLCLIYVAVSLGIRIGFKTTSVKIYLEQVNFSQFMV